MTKGGWGWSSLPQSYLTSPYLSRDDVIFTNSREPTVSNPPQESSTDLFSDDLQEITQKLPSKVYTACNIDVRVSVHKSEMHVFIIM